MERSVVYFVVAYLACWLVDLVVALAHVVTLDIALKVIIVAICLIMILFHLVPRRGAVP